MVDIIKVQIIELENPGELATDNYCGPSYGIHNGVRGLEDEGRSFHLVYC